MSEKDWTWKESLRIGAALLAAFAVMYTIVIAEIPQSFKRGGTEGMILTFFKTIIGNSWDGAGYNMMLVLTILLIGGGAMGNYGIKIVKRSLSVRGK